MKFEKLVCFSNDAWFTLTRKVKQPKITEKYRKDTERKGRPKKKINSTGEDGGCMYNHLNPHRLIHIKE